MSEITYKSGWMKNPEGDKFAPITTTDQVITKDGKVLGTELDDMNTSLEKLETTITSIDDIMNVTESGHLVDALAVKEMLLSGNGNISVSSITIGGGKLIWNAETASIDVIPVE